MQYLKSENMINILIELCASNSDMNEISIKVRLYLKYIYKKYF